MHQRSHSPRWCCSWVQAAACLIVHVLYASAAAASCAEVMLSAFEGYADNAEVLFRNPRFSQSTTANLAASPDDRGVTSAVPGYDGGKAYLLSWQFIDTATSRWLRATTFDAPNRPNPTIDFALPVRLRLRLDSPPGASLRVSLGVRETATSAAIGENGGTNGTIEWIGASSTTGGSPQGKLLPAFPGLWQTLVFDPLGDPVRAFTGNGVLASATGEGTIEHLALASTGSMGPYTLYVDTIQQLCSVPLWRTADFDRDSDVDIDDFSFFDLCMTGPVSGAEQVHPACSSADFDADGDVDQTDFGVLQRCLSGAGVAAAPDCSGVSPIPPRPADAITGSQFVTQVLNIPKATREQMVLQHILSGNVPEFLRTFAPVTVTATISGVPHTAVYQVTPDYLAIGSNADFFRIPMGPLTAQPIADAFGCLLPTRKMVNDIYTACSVKLAPHPYSPSVYDIQSVDVFNQSNQYIESQRVAAGGALGALTGGTKKDVVITTRLVAETGKVAIYGWHQLNGSPIQPLYLGHEITYMDYSHGIRLVKQTMTVDGVRRLVSEVLADPALAGLLSDEGIVTRPRY